MLPLLCLLVPLTDCSPAALARAARDSVLAVQSAKKPGTVAGCAVVIGPGLAVSCRHVLGESQTARLKGRGGQEFVARVVAEDKAADLVLLRIPAGKWLPQLPLAAEVPPVGSDVWCVGHPYGYTWTVTRGVVSAAGRVIDTPEGASIKCVQTDAAVNRGNSGGPLLNVRGEVVGVVLAISSEGPGIAFAVPAARVRALAGKAARAGGKAERDRP